MSALLFCDIVTCMEKKAEEQNRNTENGAKKQSVLTSFIEYFYGNFVVMLLGFISLPLITRIMSTDEFGKTAMFTSAVSIIYIFAILGLDQSYIRYYYREGVDRKRLLL